VKKRRKNKKIKDLSHEKNDEVIVLEAGEMLEDLEKNDSVTQAKINEENEANMGEDSMAMSLARGEKKKKKRKAKLREELEKQEQEL
jgi:hypothetical protein